MSSEMPKMLLKLEKHQICQKIKYTILCTHLPMYETDL